MWLITVEPIISPRNGRWCVVVLRLVLPTHPCRLHHPIGQTAEDPVLRRARV